MERRGFPVRPPNCRMGEMPVPLPSLCQRGQLEKLPNPSLHNLATASEQGLANNLIFQVQIQLLILYKVREESSDIAGIHHAGVIRHAIGQVDGSDDGHAMLDYRLARLRNLAVAAAFGG